MAKCGVTNIGGGGGIGSDELSVTKEYVLSGKTYVGTDTDDEIGVGIMENNGSTANQSLNAGGAFTVKKGYHSQAFNVTANNLASQTSGTASAWQILSGQTAWVNGNKLTGTMSVGSILSFSAAAYSTTQILLQWQNPYAASGRPFSGVFINYSTDGYPGYGGTRIYTGYGNNATPGGWSQVIVTMPAMGTNYYFSATAYASGSPSDMWGNTLNAVAATTARGQQAFTSSTIFTIPEGIRNIDIFCVGGGGGGGAGDKIAPANAGGGGGAGYTTYQKAIPVAPGQQINIVVGAGGEGGKPSIGNFGKDGGLSKVIINGQDYCIANGGSGAFGSGGKGGSGGGGAGRATGGASNPGGNGGSDGSNGFVGYFPPGLGQGTTTKAFGEWSNTLYAGGGGGGGNGQTDNTWRGFGGAGGGGNGADVMGNSGSNGTAGTGGGGGGGYQYGAHPGNGYDGGSGICLIRWGY